MAVVFAVHDRDYFFDNFIASVVFETEDLDRLLVVEGWFHLQRWKFDCGEIYLRVVYVPTIASSAASNYQLTFSDSQ